jgi:hypothetical protein
MSNTERTGWRDEGISKLHREFGLEVPITDIDFMVVECKYAEPVALIEYKNEHAPAVNPSSHQIRALKNLADGYRKGLPFCTVVYSDDYCTWTITPRNKKAEEILAKLSHGRYTLGVESISCDIINYVKFLHGLRGRKPSEDTINKLSDKFITPRFVTVNMLDLGFDTL